MTGIMPKCAKLVLKEKKEKKGETEEEREKRKI